MDRQLEDNTTKALINVLEHSAASLTASFLTRSSPSRLLPRAGLRPLAPRRGPIGSRRQTALACGDLHARKRRGHRGRIRGPARRRRIDAAIARHDDLLVVFEVKVGLGQLGRLQLDQHAKTWGIVKRARRYVRWEEVYDWCEGSYGPATTQSRRSFLASFSSSSS